MEIEKPVLGQVRVANEPNKRGLFVSPQEISLQETCLRPLEESTPSESNRINLMDPGGLSL